MLASGVIAVGTASMLPVGRAVGGGLVLSGAKRWNDGQATIDVVAGAAADTTGVTSFSLGLWGKDPVTGQEVPLTPEQGTYELIVGASSISMLVGMPFANGLRGPTTSIPWPKPQVRLVESFSVVGDTVVASPVRFPAITWTKGAIEVSHQGVAIATAYAGTTRIVAMMASGPMPNGAPTPSPRSQELIDILAPGGQPIGVRLGGARDSIRTLPVSCSRRTWNLRGQGFAFRPARSTSPAARLPRSSKRWVSAPAAGIFTNTGTTSRRPPLAGAPFVDYDFVVKNRIVRTRTI